MLQVPFAVCTPLSNMPPSLHLRTLGVSRCRRAHITHLGHTVLRCRHCCQDQDVVGLGYTPVLPSACFLGSLAWSLGGSLSL